MNYYKNNKNLSLIKVSDSSRIPNQTNRVKTKNKLKDIYYIILDGYPSANVLKEHFNFDNSDFINFLENNNFFIASNSTSNYPSATYLALASILNMEEINYYSKVIPKGNKSKDRTLPYDMITNNKVIQILKSYGYKYIHFKSGWGPTDSNYNADLNLVGPYDLFLKSLNNEFYIVLMRSTIIREFFTSFNLFNGQREMILYSLDKISQKPIFSSPTFYFAHILCPHPPYVFTQSGDIPKKVNMNYFGSEWNNKKGFLDQLIFLNKILKTTIDKILENSNGEPIIIIQGDHGPRSSFPDVKNFNHKESQVDKLTEQMFRERLNILNALYLPNNGIDHLYDNITPINTFPIIFNHYFGKSLNTLKDKNYWSDNINSPYKFIDITGRGRY